MPAVRSQGGVVYYDRGTLAGGVNFWETFVQSGVVQTKEVFQCGDLEGRCKATWKRELKLSWREAGPPNHLNNEVDSDH